MSGGGDSGEKTEKATAQRMKEVHRDGKLSRSQDLTAWVGIAAAGAMATSAVSAGGKRADPPAVARSALPPTRRTVSWTNFIGG